MLLLRYQWLPSRNCLFSVVLAKWKTLIITCQRSAMKEVDVWKMIKKFPNTQTHFKVVTSKSELYSNCSTITSKNQYCYNILTRQRPF